MSGAALLPGPAEAAAFAAAVFALNATPGVDSLLTISRTLQGGRRAGVSAALGIVSGCLAHTLAAAFGLAALLAVHPQAFMLIQWAGAAYLAWLGIGMLRQAWRRGAPARTDDGPSPLAPTWAEDFRTGLLTNLLNPKVAFFFLAFLPQFVPADSPSATASFLLLGLWFIGQGFLFLMGLVLVASRLSRVQESTGLRQALHAAGGLLFIGLALRLLRERPLPA